MYMVEAVWVDSSSPRKSTSSAGSAVTSLEPVLDKYAVNLDWLKTMCVYMMPAS